MKRHYRFLSAIIVLISAMALASPAFAKHEHHDGKKLVEG